MASNSASTASVAEVLRHAPFPAGLACRRTRTVVWHNEAAAALASAEGLRSLIGARLENAAEDGAPALDAVLDGLDSGDPQDCEATCTDSGGAAMPLRATWVAHACDSGSESQALFFIHPPGGLRWSDTPEAGSDYNRFLRRRLENIRRELTYAGLMGPPAGSRMSAKTLRGMERLSNREREVLDLIASGLRVPTISKRLFLSQSTVRNHLSAVFRKLGVGSQAELLERLGADEMDSAARF